MIIFTCLRIRLGTEQTVGGHLFSYILPSLLHKEGRSNLGREDQFFAKATAKAKAVASREEQIANVEWQISHSFPSGDT